MLGVNLAAARRTGAWWSPGAVFAADFVNDRYMRNGVGITRAEALTITRASSKLAQTAAGQWLSFPPDTLARTDLGASIEPAATNYIQNSIMAGAVAGTPGTIPAGWTVPASANGLLRQVVGVGATRGLPHVDIRFSGTTTAESFVNIDLAGANYVPTLPGDAWSLSCSVALIAGSLSGLNPALACRLRTAMFTAANGYIGELMANPTLDFSGGEVFQTQSATVSNGRFLLPYFQFWYTSGSNIDFSVRVSVPQLERTGVTSPVLTSVGVASRAADSVSAMLSGPADVLVSYSDGSTSNYHAASTPVILQVASGRKTIRLVEAF